MVQKHEEYIITAEESQIIKLVKLICAVLVVFIHAMPVPETPVRLMATFVRFIWVDCICSCAVPVFFMLSGILLFRKPFVWKRNLQKKACTLLIPYFSISTFWFFFLFCAQNISITSRFFTDTRYLRVTSWSVFDWIQAYTIGLIKEPDSWYGPAMSWLWFLRDLFVLNVFAPLLKQILDVFPKVWFCGLGFLWIVAGTLNGSCYRPIAALLFFSLGYAAVKHDVHFDDLKRLDTRFLWCVWAACCAVGYICHERNRFLYGVSSILCILSIGCLLMRIAEGLTTRYPGSRFASLTRYSLAIYLFHEKSLSFAMKIVRKAGGYWPDSRKHSRVGYDRMVYLRSKAA